MPRRPSQTDRRTYGTGRSLCASFAYMRRRHKHERCSLHETICSHILHITVNSSPLPSTNLSPSQLVSKANLTLALRPLALYSNHSFNPNPNLNFDEFQRVSRVETTWRRADCHLWTIETMNTLAFLCPLCPLCTECSFGLTNSCSLM